jgi:hypothetical protein
MGKHSTDDERGVEAEEFTQLLPAPPVQEPPEERLRELRRSVMSEIRAQRPRRRRRRRRLVVTAVGLGAAAVALFAGATIASESGSHRQHANDLRPNSVTDLGHSGSPSPYPTNASGQTYGPHHPGAGFPELMAAHASRGENGYLYWEDLMGPVSGPGEEKWFLATQNQHRREVPLYESDGVTQVGVFIAGGGSTRHVSADGTVTETEVSNKLAEQPPVWLFDQMKQLASNAGDAHAWAWWTMTTAEKAAAATGNSSAGMTDPNRPVYVAFIVGDFTSWLWSLPEGTSAPVYSWIFEVIDAGSHEVELTGASAKPFEGGLALDLSLVGLRDRVRM